MICPQCGHEFEPEEREPVTVETLLAWCQENGHPVYPGQRVNETVAAMILGVADGTMRNWRSSGTGPVYVRTGGNRGKISYKLCDLAGFLRLSE